MRRWTPTRARQAGLGSLFLGLTVALSPFVGRFLLTEARSMGQVLGLEILLVALALAGSFFLSLALLGALWPRRFGGPRLLDLVPPPLPPGSESPDEDADLTPVARVTTLPLALLVALGLWGVSILGNHLGQGFLGRQREIRYRTLLRSEEPARQRAVLRELAQSEFQAVLETFVDPIWSLSRRARDPAVREDALWALAHIANRMRTSVLIRHAQAELQGFERVLLERLKRQYASQAVARFRSDLPRFRRPLFRFLLYVDPPRAVAVAQVYVNHPSPDPALLRDMAALLSRTVDLGAGEVLLELSRRDEPEIHGLALVSLAKLLALFDPDKLEVPDEGAPGALGHKEPRLLGRLRKRLRRDLASQDPARRCAAAEALAHLKDAGFTQALIQAFDPALKQTTPCPRLAVASPWAGEELIVAPETLVIKVLRALASVAVGNAEVARFLERTLERQDLPDTLRQEITNIRALLQRAQDAGEASP